MRNAPQVARLRRRLARLAWRAALGPTSGSLPLRSVGSLAGDVGAIADRVGEVELLAPAHLEHYEFEPSAPRRFRRSKAHDDRYFYRVRDVCAAPRTGLCWLADGPILIESIGSFQRLIGWGAGVLEEPLVGARTSIDGPAVLLAADRYFHWLLEDLPALLHTLERAPGATVIVARDAPRYLDEALELLGITNVYRSDEPVRVGELLLTGRSPGSSFVPREDVEVVRRRLLPLVARGADEALYVSRRLDGRNPVNELELERALAQLGYRIVNAQQLSFPAQVELFAGARVVAATHGAGLANVVWTPGGAVSELFVAGSFNDCYARLAVSLGASYQAFYCSERPAPHGSAPVAEMLEAARRLNGE